MRDSGTMRLTGHTVLFGGSFNPPHMGHQMLCLYLLEAVAAESVWMIPSHHHPFGKSLARFEERVQMCRILARHFDGRIEVCTIEADPGATGRTYDTVSQLCNEHPNRRFALAVGSDIMGETKQWHRWDDIVGTVQLVVIGRAGYPSDQAVPVDLPAISSEAIRGLLQAGSSIEGLVPAAVADYISMRSLYRE